MSYVCVLCVCDDVCIFDLNDFDVMAASWQQEVVPFLHFDLKQSFAITKKEEELKKHLSAQHDTNVVSYICAPESGLDCRGGGRAGSGADLVAAEE